MQSNNNCFFTYSKNNSPNNLPNYITIFQDKKNSLTKGLNIFTFLKQKNKFYLQDFYDEKGAEKFLISKKMALMEIQLNDEIGTSNINDDTVNNNSIKDNSNKNVTKENNVKINKIIHKGITMTPQEKKINKLKTEKSIKTKDEHNNKNSCDSNSFHIISKCNKESNDASDCNYIYKFIIDNNNDSDDKLLKKLKKEIKRTETKKLNNKKKLSVKKNTPKINIINTNDNTSKVKSEKKLNPFNFSIKAKNLMINEKIEISSINNDDNTNVQDNNKIKTICTTNKTNNINNFVVQRDIVEKKNLINNIEFISNKESLKHILSDLK